ncbi:hypothetical protein MTR_5g062975 [Medicago truncatula]|uniref:Uncharacterized protein n=1 Tax=Medicago truncatula TaxID=3880 RepID=A0A072UG10_MEDTR|nr:hypothetical protein MTR_5g062975 [Medicago truncatula]
MADESAPMYIAVAQTKKRAENPPVAANDIRSDISSDPSNGPNWRILQFKLIIVTKVESIIR